MLETPSERTASEAADSSVHPEVEIVTLSPSMQLRMRAAQLLREKGWCRRAFHDEGSMCLVGAISDACGDFYAHWSETLRELASSLDIDWRDLPIWNDAPGRTKEQVIALLEGRDWEAE